MVSGFHLIFLHMFKLQFLFFFIFSVIALPAFSQMNKIERELKVKPHLVPENARSFIEASYKGKVKWYQEYNQTGMYFEAKFKREGENLSVKFDSTGAVYDVEELFQFSSAEFPAKAQIKTMLTDRFIRYRIWKAQRQWTGDPGKLKKIISGDSDLDIKPKFELVVRGRKKGDVAYYELVFSNSGELLTEKRFAGEHLNNLIY